MTPFFGIRISTYRRPSGTYHLLHRCLKHVLAQTYTKWKVFLIGDCYDPDDEFRELASMIPADKIYSYNLPESPERGKYSDHWKVAGCTASKIGLAKVQEEGLIHAALDDDDVWKINHLETLADAYTKFPEAVFVYAKSTYRQEVLPREDVQLSYNNLPPRAYNLIHSAASWDTTRLPLMYRNIIDEKCNYVAGDAEMWDRVAGHCYLNRLKTLYVPQLTVLHPEEQNEHQRMEPIIG